jgi:hypothetical protein
MDVRFQVSRIGNLKQGLVSTGFPYDVLENPGQAMKTSARSWILPKPCDGMAQPPWIFATWPWGASMVSGRLV